MCCERNKKRGYSLPIVVILMMLVFNVFLIISNTTVNLYEQYKYCYKNLDSIHERSIKEYDFPKIIKDNILNKLSEKGVKINGISDLRVFLKNEKFEMDYEGFKVTYKDTNTSQKFIVKRKSTGKCYDFYLTYENQDIKIIYKE